jgi:hypothetical protein
VEAQFAFDGMSVILRHGSGRQKLRSSSQDSPSTPFHDR